ncbi:hypothetical protein DSECCO2_599940 [anaerobic digester metagenome]
MRHRCKGILHIQRRRTDHLGGRIGCNQLRKLGFYHLELTGQRVIFKIFYFRVVIKVVLDIVIIDLPAQLDGALLGLSALHSMTPFKKSSYRPVQRHSAVP